MSQTFWLAVGLVLILEGLGPLLAPRGWRKLISQLSNQDDQTLRRLGGCLVVAGGVIAYLMFSRL
ncbi:MULTISPECIES: DUF2065 domain-containing protein [Photobacterium]|uniref:Membrane protein n=1 Tax=Photobacterium halotolerans TaxID=265726 RepID=A0A0F5V767_9GAMM|nr:MULTISPECIES: DUF2065 domain-containing protein [Photobacterium]KKC97937.1 membrane protein [Photobacterium halotolerans]UIP27722.1 DUF2065 domain-containing protein [Photobacterium sp. TLY01]